MCARTVQRELYSLSAQGNYNQDTPVEENWLYLSKPKPKIKTHDNNQENSPERPEWFKVNKRSENKQKEESEIEILSKIWGWIYVSPKSKNRKHRLGVQRSQDDKELNLQNVSNLAPKWMQRRSQITPMNQFTSILPPPTLRKEPKRMFLFDNLQPEKSIYSVGDFKHNVITKEEAIKNNEGLSYKPKIFFEWKEEINKQGYDKPITSKIGQY